MNLKPLRSHPHLLSATYDEAFRLFQTGDIGLDVWRAYKWVWTWREMRFSAVANAGALQDQFDARHGFNALERRRIRVRAWVNAVTKPSKLKP